LTTRPATTPPGPAALRAALERLSPLDDASFRALAGSILERRVSTSDVLLRAGEVSRFAIFVRSGLLREYYVDDEGRVATRRLCVEGEFSGSLADLLSGAPSMTWIEALEDGELLLLPWAVFDALTRVHPPLQALARRIAEDLYLRKCRREFEMLTLPAATRYARFREEHPSLDARLARHVVASYLGITPVHLSRLRSAGTPSRAAGAPRRRS
jgi:CRP-like cAMP-binding protein